MYEADGTNFESWCSEDLSYSSNRSVQPSTDTEMLVAGHAAMLGVQGQARQPHGYMYGMARLQHGSTVLPQEATGTAEAVAAGTEPDHVPEMWHPYGPEQQALEQHALGNLTRSVQAYPTPAKETPPTAMLVTRGFTAEDFDLDDPYHEPDDGDKQHHMHHHNYHGTQMNPNGVSHLPHSITGLPVRQDQETTQLGPRFSQHVYGAGGPAHAVQEQQQPQPEASNGYGIGLQHSIYRELHDSRGETCHRAASIVQGVCSCLQDTAGAGWLAKQLQLQGGHYALCLHSTCLDIQSTLLSGCVVCRRAPVEQALSKGQGCRQWPAQPHLCIWGHEWGQRGCFPRGWCTLSHGSWQVNSR
jgi:hypothetical protein